MVKFRALAVAGVMAASMVTLGAGAASASVTPTPTFTRTPPRPVPVQNCAQRPVTFTPTAGPTDDVSPTDEVSTTDEASPLGRVHPSGNPTVNPQRRCSPETFVSQFTEVGNVVTQNRVIAAGPVSGTGSLDLAAQTNTFDRFRLPAFFRSVNVPHTGLAFPAVNLRLCTASVVQIGLWRFAGGVGAFRNAIGNGTYQLVGQWVFPRLRNGACSLLFLRGNPILQNRIQPTYTNIQVWANGLARR